MPKHSKKRRRRSSKSPIKKAKKVDSNFVNFLSFVIGLATSLMLIALIYKTFDPNARYSTNKIDANPEIEIQLTDYDEIVANDSPSELVNFLIKMEDWPRTASLPARFEFQRKRIDIAKQLLTHKLDDVSREIAIVSKIEAASQLYGMDFISKVATQDENSIDFAELLRTAIGDYPNDSNLNVARDALLALAKLSFYEFSKTKDNAYLDDALEAVIRLVQDHPDIESITVTRDLVTRLLQKDDEEQGHQLIAKLFETFKESDVDDARNLAIELNDRSIFKRHDFNHILSNRRVLGDRGRKQITEAMLKMLDYPELGLLFFDIATTAINWLDECSSFENTKLIYQKMVDVSGKLVNPEVQLIAKTKGVNGLKRIIATSSAIEFSDQATDGTTVSNEQLLGTLTVVFYWSAKDSSSKSMVEKFGQELNRDYANNLNVIAVCVDPAPTPAVVKRLTRLNAKQLGNNSELAKVFPVETLPYIAIFDHNGHAKKISIKLPNLETQIGFLRSQMRKLR